MGQGEPADFYRHCHFGEHGDDNRDLARGMAGLRTGGAVTNGDRRLIEWARQPRGGDDTLFWLAALVVALLLVA